MGAYSPNFNVNSPIRSLYIGLSKETYSNTIHKRLFISSCIYLSNIEVNGEFGEKDYGVLLLYGDYNVNNDIKYQYVYEKNDQIGLRYAIINYNDFEKKFSAIASIPLEILDDNTIDFSTFMAKIKKIKDWNKSSYNAFNNNSLHFSAEVIRIFNPRFDVRNIWIKDYSIKIKKKGDNSHHYF